MRFLEMSKTQLSEAVEKYHDIIKMWSEGTDPFKKALADTVLEAAEKGAVA